MDAGRKIKAEKGEERVALMQGEMGVGGGVYKIQDAWATHACLFDNACFKDISR